MTKITDIEVWRAAQQFISSHPEDPELAVWQRADAAWEEGEMSNLQLWMRIAQAVEPLIRTKPHNGKAIN